MSAAKLLACACLRADQQASASQLVSHRHNPSRRIGLEYGHAVAVSTNDRRHWLVRRTRQRNDLPTVVTLQQTKGRARGQAKPKLHPVRHKLLGHAAEDRIVLKSAQIKALWHVEYHASLPGPRESGGTDVMTEWNEHRRRGVGALLDKGDRHGRGRRKLRIASPSVRCLNRTSIELERWLVGRYRLCWRVSGRLRTDGLGRSSRAGRRRGAVRRGRQSDGRDRRSVQTRLAGRSSRSNGRTDARQEGRLVSARHWVENVDDEHVSAAPTANPCVGQQAKVAARMGDRHRCDAPARHRTTFQITRACKPEMHHRAVVLALSRRAGWKFQDEAVELLVRREAHVDWQSSRIGLGHPDLSVLRVCWPLPGESRRKQAEYCGAE